MKCEFFDFVDFPGAVRGKIEFIDFCNALGSGKSKNYILGGFLTSPTAAWARASLGADKPGERTKI